MFTAASQHIAGKWKTNIALSLDDWLFKIKQVFLLSKLTAINKYRTDYLQAIETFKKQGHPFRIIFEYE